MKTKLAIPRWLSEVGWRTAIAAVLLGGIVHIGATLAVPFVSPGQAFARLRDTLPMNRMVVLPPPAPGKQPLPYLAPDALYAMCRYDVSVDSLVVSVAMGDIGWTLSLHTPQGDNFYVMPAQSQRRADVSLTVVPGIDRLGDFVAAPRRPTTQETQIASPSWEGLVMVRAPLKGLAWRAETEAQLRRATCTPVKRQQ
jgi:uncharacterized membrane protein